MEFTQKLSLSRLSLLTHSFPPNTHIYITTPRVSIYRENRSVLGLHGGEKLGPIFPAASSYSVALNPAVSVPTIQLLPVCNPAASCSFQLFLQSSLRVDFSTDSTTVPFPIMAFSGHRSKQNSDLLQPTYADLEELKELGSGTFGTVYHEKWRETDVAIKRIKKSCFQEIKDLWREAQILSTLHHPNVVAFYGVVPCVHEGTLATVTEFMASGLLRNVLLRKDRLEILACQELNATTLVSSGVRGTLPWMAPELLNGSSIRLSKKVDVFSFGIVMWEILTGEEPYANMHCGAIIGGIENKTLRPPIPKRCDPEWKRLMEECWSPDPAAGPSSFTEIPYRLRDMSTALRKKQRSANR